MELSTKVIIVMLLLALMEQTQHLLVSYYDEHYHSYVICETSHLYLSLINTVISVSHNVLHSRKMHGNVYLTLKHYIFVYVCFLINSFLHSPNLIIKMVYKNDYVPPN